MKGTVTVIRVLKNHKWDTVKVKSSGSNGQNVMDNAIAKLRVDYELYKNGKYPDPILTLTPFCVEDMEED